VAVGWAIVTGHWGMRVVEVITWCIGGAIYLEYRAVSHG
jgi:hypothetical protein